MVDISIAKLSDTASIMKFMNDVWREGHILSKNRELFLHEFQDGNLLNFIIAKSKDNSIVGLFGFIKYNSSKIPDIAGSLWKIDPKIVEPLLGLKLREYFKKNIRHRFFAAPGAGLQTKPIYKIIKMNWNRMEQYYIANSNIDIFKITKNPIVKSLEIIKSDDVELSKMINIEDVEKFDFYGDAQVVPQKDFSYFKKRFVDYPISKYDIFYLKKENKIQNIFVCKISSVEDSSVYRIVDFYGNFEYIKEIASFLYAYIIKNDFEYVDFVAYGLDNNLLLNAGFSILDFEKQERIIPNFFEPFMQKNVPVYCVSDKTELTFRQYKADGDQDRPNS